jgi:hypothetical protein
MTDAELRYHDQPSVETTLAIDAPAAVVWPLVTDIELPARFSSEFQGARYLDDVTGPAIGARFAGRNHHDAIGSWETISTITELEPERSFGYVVGSPAEPSSAWRFTLRPTESGVTLSMWMQMGPARSGINVAIDAMPEKEGKILRRRLAEHRANMDATLQGIKSLAETVPR